jgi:hypothetical protein
MLLWSLSEKVNAAGTLLRNCREEFLADGIDSGHETVYVRRKVEEIEDFCKIWALY